MDIRNVSYDDVVRIVNKVSERDYAGNLKVHNDAKPLGTKGFRGRFDTRDSRAYGSRTSWSGRHGKWISWEGTRDILIELFKEFPDAKVKTAMARYYGRDEFYATFYATGDVNVGSMAQPVTMRELTI